MVNLTWVAAVSVVTEHGSPEMRAHIGWRFAGQVQQSSSQVALSEGEDSPLQQPKPSSRSRSLQFLSTLLSFSCSIDVVVRFERTMKNLS